MALSKRQILIGGVLAAATSVVIGALYLQYKRVTDFVISLKHIKIKSLTASLFSIDLYLGFLNKSDITLLVTKQAYTVYLNGKKTLSAGNAKAVTILKGDNIIPVSVSFNPQQTLKDLGGVEGLAQYMLAPDKLKMEFHIKLYIRFAKVINIPANFVYKTTLKEMLAAKKEA